MKPLFIDLHCDTLFTLRREACTLEDAPGHINLEKLVNGGALLQCFADFIPMHEAAAEYGIQAEPWDFFLEQAALFRRESLAYPDRLAPVNRFSDIEKNRAEGRVSAMLTVEDGACINGDITRLHTVYDLGVRLITLTWNYENCLGYPNSPDYDIHTKKGLKPFGFEAVDRMNNLGIVVDVSHLSEAGFYDVARHSKKPFAASHSCCRALADHPRNLTDDQLRTIGNTGSVVGINFYDLFLGSKPGYTETEAIIRHMVYAKNKAGIEGVALGSDFDGIESKLEFDDYAGYPQLLAAMEKAFTEDEIDRICEKNFLRVFSA